MPYDIRTHLSCFVLVEIFFFQAEDGIRDDLVTGVQTCALPISMPYGRRRWRGSRPTRPPPPSVRHGSASRRRLSAPSSSWRRSEERRVGKECRTTGRGGGFGAKWWWISRGGLNDGEGGTSAPSR